MNFNGAHFLRVGGAGMRRLRAVVTFFLIPAKQIPILYVQRELYLEMGTV